MTKVEQAAQNMERLAADNSHGYDQANRWGPDYDCSSAVITAWEMAGVPVKSYGASYTGNMYPVFKSCGFADVTSQINLATGAGLLRGDVLLNHRSHTAMYVGYGTIAQASLNENGGITGGQTGDQTGGEICLRAYYNYPWDVVLRFVKDSGSSEGHADTDDGEKSDVYEVQPGDTLYGISIKTGVPMADIVRINKIQNPDIIHVGEVFKLKDEGPVEEPSKDEESIEEPSKGEADEEDLTNVARRVIRGEFGNGVIRTILLKMQGYDPAEVQKIVNKLMGV